MRQSAGKVPWNSIVWYHRDVPKWAFICRLWCLGKLATKDRLRNGGMNVDEACVLCTQQNESHQNLFFEYYFSRGIWSNIIGRCMFQRRPWGLGVLRAIAFCRGDSFITFLSSEFSNN